MKSSDIEQSKRAGFMADFCKSCDMAHSMGLRHHTEKGEAALVAQLCQTRVRIMEAFRVCKHCLPARLSEPNPVSVNALEAKTICTSFLHKGELNHIRVCEGM